jgi:hypothetical protein
MIHEPILALIRQHFPYIFHEYGFTPIQWVERTPGHRYYRIRFSSQSHTVEFEYDDPFIISWLGLASDAHLFRESLLVQFLDPDRVFPDAVGLVDRLLDMSDQEGADFQLERLNRLLWQPYLTQFMGTELYQDEAALIASANPSWMVRKNEWREY